MAHALAGTRRAHPDRSSAATSCRRKPRTGDPTAVWKDLRYRTTRVAGSTSAAREFQPYTHYNVGGNTKFWGSVLYRLRREDFRRSSTSTACRRPGRSTTRRWRRTTIARSGCTACTARSATIRRSRRAGRFHIRPSRTRRGWRRSSSSCARRACIRRRCRSACCVPASRRLRAVQHLQLVPVPHPREERRGSLLRAAGDRAAERHALDQRAGARAWSPTRPAGGSRRSRSQRNGDVERVSAPLFIVSCGAVNSAALLLRSASDAHPDGLANSSGLVGRRYMAHLATMMQGFHLAA